MTRVEQGGVNVSQTCSEWEKLKFMSCLFVETLIQDVWTVVDHRQPEIQKWRARMRQLLRKAQDIVGKFSPTPVKDSFI